MASAEQIFQHNCRYGSEEGVKLLLAQIEANDPGSVHHFVNRRNSMRYAPLHTAVFARNLGTCKALLETGQVDLDLKCHGTPVLHLVLNTAVLPEGREFAMEVFRLLVSQENIDLSARDDQMATALHVASEYNLVECIKMLLSIPDACDVDAKDRTGMRPLHRAASRDASEACKCLLVTGGAQIDPQTPYGSTPLHLAAANSAAAAWKVLVEAGADPAAGLSDCWGRTPADLVQLNGWKFSDKKHAAIAPASKKAGESAGGTAIITHPICRRHFTCEPSQTEEPSAPPENVKRLHVVIDETHGSLCSADLAPSLQWVPQCRAATMSDVLRVHEWAYVRRIQGFCEAIPGDAEGDGGIGSIDGDTTLCHDSFTAALCAAGAVTQGVDMVCRGLAQNTFAPVRPPGHHAGPKGLVKGQDGGPDSHGFCLLNNVSIGAAYALNVHRDIVRRVAIVDFDVHHGNGTEETIRWLKPGVEDVALFDSELFGSLSMPRYKPWFDQNDTDNVLFVSVHGYGPREQGLEHLMPQAAFYPGSGKTIVPEVTTPAAAAAVEGAGVGAGADGAAGAAGAAGDATNTQMATGSRSKQQQKLSDAPFTGVKSPQKGSDEDDEDDEEDEDFDGEGAEGQGMEMEMVDGDREGRGSDDNDDDDDDDEDDEGVDVSGSDYRGQSSEPSGGSRIRSKLATMRRLYSKAPASASVNGRPPVPPLILDVGVPLPESSDVTSADYRHMWRNYFRERIFPSMMRFKPDLILISAGFDAHKKDTINGGYIALVEEDFEWVTGHLVRVANSCCEGRVVSVLEGGYQILGEHCSAFAKSVKAHVTALSSGAKGSVPYSQEDADRERDVERQLLDEAARKRAEKAAREAAAHAALIEARRQEAAAAMLAAEAIGSSEEGEGAEPAVSSETPASDDGARKRRRKEVDYVALNKELSTGGGATSDV